MITEVAAGATRPAPAVVDLALGSLDVGFPVLFPVPGNPGTVGRPGTVGSVVGRPGTVGSEVGRPGSVGSLVGRADARH